MEGAFNPKINIKMIQLTHLEEIQLRDAYVEAKEDTTLLVLSKVEAKLNRYVPKKDLLHIHEDIDTAIDLIMYFITNFSSSYIRSLNTNSKEEIEGFININYEVQRERYLSLGLGYKSSPHPKIIKLLIKHGIIEKGSDYIVGVKSRSYRPTKPYFGKGLTKYKIRTNIIKERIYNEGCVKFNELLNHPIAINSLITNLDIQFPTDKEAIEEITKYVEAGHTNKEGKRLVWAGKNPGRYPKTEFIHAEDHLKLLQTYRDMPRIPVLASEIGGYRVYDRYNMLPKTVRGLVTLSHKKVRENDYECFHPNIIQTLYSDNPMKISHKMIAEALTENFTDLNKEEQAEAIQKYKIAHLSFFNLPVDKMKYSAVYPYYEKYDRKMLMRIEDEKMISEEWGDTNLGSRITARNLFGLEVEIMGEVISRLHKERIKVLYLFDALCGHEENLDRIAEVMNEVVEEYSVQTTANIE